MQAGKVQNRAGWKKYFGGCSPLEFDADEVAVLIAHAESCAEHLLTLDERCQIYGDNVFNHQEGEEKKGSAALWLVKDEGIYLMSNGLPADQPDPSKEGRRVVYAKGFDPNKDGDVWEACRAAVGGDDFCERIDLPNIKYQIENFGVVGIRCEGDKIGY